MDAAISFSGMKRKIRMDLKFFYYSKDGQIEVYL